MQRTGVPGLEFERALGMALTRVVYFNLADAAWDMTPGVDRLDYGVDLTFGTITLGVTWGSPGQRLEVRPSSLGPCCYMR